MHWAGAQRAVEVADALGAEELAARARDVEARAAAILEEQCWNDEVGALTQVAGEPQLDAVNLLAVHVGFFEPDDPRAARTWTRSATPSRSTAATACCAAMRPATTSGTWRPRSRCARSGSWRRWRSSGRTDEAQELFERLLSLSNGLGLYSEDVLPDTLSEQTGNFPQTYSHVGLINAAFRLSRRWD